MNQLFIVKEISPRALSGMRRLLMVEHFSHLESLKCVRAISFSHRLYAGKDGGKDVKDSKDEGEEVPSFLKSKVHQDHKALETFINVKAREEPRSKRPIFLISLALFMLYFWFREENDLDQILGQELFETVPELEKPLILSTIESFKRQGRDTKELEERLKMVIAKEQGQSNKASSASAKAT